MVVSVGEHVYLALAKGGLVPEHLLILPITHFQSTSDLDGDSRQGKEVKELVAINGYHFVHVV